MATIETKYNIGDMVYAIQVWTDNKWVECPDCLGTCTWWCVLPNGDSVNIDCPTCKSGYQTLGKVTEYVGKGRVQPLTIGQIKYGYLDDNKACYMCEETGIGSGTVWREGDLLADKAEAESLLPMRIEKCYQDYMDNLVSNLNRNPKRKHAGDLQGNYRREIDKHKKQIKELEKQLARVVAHVE